MADVPQDPPVQQTYYPPPTPGQAAAPDQSEAVQTAIVDSSSTLSCADKPWYNRKQHGGT